MISKANIFSHFVKKKGDFMEKVILHCDMNNFYASVECFLNPSLRGKPVAVCGDPEKRHGIVLAKNMPAKLMGVKTAEPLWQAKQKCPDIVFVPPHYDIYMKYSEKAKEIYNSYTNRVESFGLDECWLDLSDRDFTIEDGRKAADEIRDRIKKELGVTVSVGVSFNKIFAKLGSDMKKPDATTVISRENFRKKIWNLKANELLYVGRATYRKLLNLNIVTIGDLAASDPKTMQSNFGKVGLMIRRFARGEDDGAVAMIDNVDTIKSIGNGITLPYDLFSTDDIKITLIALCESVARRLRKHSLCCSGISLSIRDNSLCFFERQTKTPFPLNCSNEIFKTAYSLYNESKQNIYSARALTVKAINLSPSHREQLSFLDEYRMIQKNTVIDKAMDKIREKYGYKGIYRGIMLKNPDLADINPFEDNLVHPVSYLKEAINI